MLKKIKIWATVQGTEELSVNSTYSYKIGNKEERNLEELDLWELASESWSGDNYSISFYSKSYFDGLKTFAVITYKNGNTVKLGTFLDKELNNKTSLERIEKLVKEMRRIKKEIQEITFKHLSKMETRKYTI